MTQVSIIGAGNMGTAMAQVLARNGHRVHVWDIDQVVLRQIAAKRVNQKQLPGIKLHQGVAPKPSHVECMRGADIVLLAVPSVSVLGVVEKIKPLLLPNMIIFSVIKGLDKKTLQPIALSIQKNLPKYLKNRFVNMTGPAVASEFARQSPTAVEIASPNSAATRQIKNILQNNYFRVIITKDLKGAALCASLKNTYAILFGIADCLSFTLNTKAVIFAHAIREMQNILVRLHADPETAVSLSGIGDLAVTGFNAKSRNVTYGRLICEKSVKDPLQVGLNQVAEGYYSTPLFSRLMKKKNISAPLVFLADAILKKKINPKKGLINFLEKLS